MVQCAMKYNWSSSTQKRFVDAVCIHPCSNGTQDKLCVTHIFVILGLCAPCRFFAKNARIPFKRLQTFGTTSNICSDQKIRVDFDMPIRGRTNSLDMLKSAVRESERNRCQLGVTDGRVDGIDSESTRQCSCEASSIKRFI